MVLKWRRKWQPTPALLPGKSHGWRSLVGKTQWGRKESDTTERLTHTYMVLKGASLVAQMVKNLPAVLKTWVQSLGQEDPLEEEMATHSTVLAWRSPWTEEPGKLQSMGLHRVRHDWINLPCLHGVKESFSEDFWAEFWQVSSTKRWGEVDVYMAYLEFLQGLLEVHRIIAFVTWSHLVNYHFRPHSPFKYCCCSAAKSCPTLCDPMDCSTSGFLVLHCLLQFAQIHVHWVGDAI